MYRWQNFGWLRPAVLRLDLPEAIEEVTDLSVLGIDTSPSILLDLANLNVHGLGKFKLPVTVSVIAKFPPERLDSVTQGHRDGIVSSEFPVKPCCDQLLLTFGMPPASSLCDRQAGVSNDLQTAIGELGQGDAVELGHGADRTIVSVS